jgi:hypothetical protein
VTVNALHPGIVDTELMRHMGIFNSFFGKLAYPFLWLFTKRPNSGAQTSLYCALEPSLEKVSGEYFANCNKAEMAETAKDEKMALWLWKLSEKWCRIEN